jgi:hypothetical protein
VGRALHAVDSPLPRRARDWACGGGARGRLARRGQGLRSRSSAQSPGLRRAVEVPGARRGPSSPRDCSRQPQRPRDSSGSVRTRREGRHAPPWDPSHQPGANPHRPGIDAQRAGAPARGTPSPGWPPALRPLHAPNPRPAGPEARDPHSSAIIATGPAPTRSVLGDVVLDLLLHAGFEHPDATKPIVVDGRRIVPDFRWPAHRLIVEADSSWHDRKLDAERQALLEAHGERVAPGHLGAGTMRRHQTVAALTKLLPSRRRR